MNLKSNSVSLLSATLFAATLLSATTLPTIVSADEGYQSDRTVIYFTRHAEKKTTTVVRDDITPLPYSLEDDGNRGSNRDDQCGASKCAEELNALGLLRAQMLADWFDRKNITGNITHVYSSHKVRTRQTVEEIATRAGLNNDADLISDGVQQLPADKTELDPQSTSPSEQPTIEAIFNLQGGDVAVIAGHSGTLYDIMEGIGIDTSDTSDFPRDEDGKVRDFGDLWKVVIKNGNVRFKWRRNLQPTRLVNVETEPGLPIDSSQ